MRVTFDSKKDVINRRKHGISLARPADFDMTSAKFERDDFKTMEKNAITPSDGWMRASSH